jgi:hypothetical protein
MELKMSVGRPRLDKRRPECLEVELSCEECVRAAARSLALVTDDLPLARLRTLFHAMFPDSNCRPMVNQFVQIVNSIQQAEPQEIPVIRKPPVFAPAPLRVRVAVA